MAPEPLLYCHGLEAARGGQTLFSKLGFSLMEESTLILTGENGGGKTTLLKILAGLLRPDAGEIRWRGTRVRAPADYGGEVAYIGHRNAVWEEASVAENLSFWAHMGGEAMLVPAAMRYFGLERFADIPCRQLSAGWKRRTALARLLLLQRARLWLLDEPAAHLDDEAAALLGGLIESRARKGGCVILAMHGISGTTKHSGISTLELKNFAIR